MPKIKCKSQHIQDTENIKFAVSQLKILKKKKQPQAQNQLFLKREIKGVIGCLAGMALV